MSRIFAGSGRARRALSCLTSQLSDTGRVTAGHGMRHWRATRPAGPTRRDRPMDRPLCAHRSWPSPPSSRAAVASGRRQLNVKEMRRPRGRVLPSAILRFSPTACATEFPARNWKPQAQERATPRHSQSLVSGSSLGEDTAATSFACTIRSEFSCVHTVAFAKIDTDAGASRTTTWPAVSE